jgi:hypothetical protein
MLFAIMITIEPLIIIDQLQHEICPSSQQGCVYYEMSSVLEVPVVALEKPREEVSRPELGDLVLNLDST